MAKWEGFTEEDIIQVSARERLVEGRCYLRTFIFFQVVYC